MTSYIVHVDCGQDNHQESMMSFFLVGKFQVSHILNFRILNDVQKVKFTFLFFGLFELIAKDLLQISCDLMPNAILDVFLSTSKANVFENVSFLEDWVLLFLSQNEENRV